MLRLTVAAAQRADPRFIELLKNSEAFFNCRMQCCFNDKFRSLLCLHEGAHGYFAREVGARNIKFHGPEMFWDSRPEYDCPAISKSSLSWDEPRGGFDAEVAKANLAGFICRREMSDTPNDEIAISADFAVSRERFNRHIGAGEDAFKLCGTIPAPTPILPTLAVKAPEETTGSRSASENSSPVSLNSLETK